MKTEDPIILHFVEVEDCIDHFYLDTKGILTIGIGCQVFDPSGLKMSVTARPATAGEIVNDILAVRSLRPGLLASIYGKVTTCRMADDDIIALFNERWAATEGQLAALLGRPIGDLPLPAQMAIMDMAFNMGPHRLFDPLPRGFPHFIAAFKARDWATCAEQCQRQGVQQSRNDWTRQQFDSLKG